MYCNEISKCERLSVPLLAECVQKSNQGASQRGLVNGREVKGKNWFVLNPNTPKPLFTLEISTLLLTQFFLCKFKKIEKKINYCR